MTPQDFELLRAVCENSGFAQLLKAMADHRRAEELNAIEVAHAGQNQTAAAMVFGRLQFMEDLPEFFQSVYREQKRDRKFAD